jgi:hypothetical protein
LNFSENWLSRAGNRAVRAESALNVAASIEPSLLAGMVIALDAEPALVAVDGDALGHLAAGAMPVDP